MKKMQLALVASIILLSLSSCISQPQEFAFDPPKSHELETDDVSITLSLIPEDKLIEQLGKNGNVFMQYPALLMKKSQFVYQIDIESKNKELILNPRNIILTVGKASSQSKYRQQLIDSWSKYLKNEEQMERAIQLTKRYMLDNKTKLTPAAPVSGLIVFLQDYPDLDGNDVSIRLGLEQEDGSLIEITVPLSY